MYIYIYIYIARWIYTFVSSGVQSFALVRPVFKSSIWKSW